jgi:formate dehydrogenase iron-sulfur subunit
MAVVEKAEIVIDAKTGAVLYTEKTKDISYKDTLEGCPYNIPRQDPKTKLMAKCTMCNDRLTAGQQPACVKSCPTGAMQFGPRDKILEAANKCVAALKNAHPKAQALDADDVRVIYVVVDDMKNYK